MAVKNLVVYGIYSHRSQAEAGVERLIGAGFRKEDISVLMQDNTGTKDFAHEKNTKAPEGTVTGVLVGGAIGGLFGLVVGLGILVIPGLGPLLAAGPVIGALTGVGAGAIVGGIIGALIGLGTPEYEAKRYDGHLKSGGILASVHCDSREWVSKAKEALRQTGAGKISSTSEARADFASSDRPYSATGSSREPATLSGLSSLPPPQPQPVRATATTPVSVKTVSTAVPLADEADFRQHFQSRAGVSGTDYTTYASAYRYGHEAAHDAQHRGRSFEEVEPELRSEYARRFPADAWDRMRDSVRYGWSKVSKRT